MEKIIILRQLTAIVMICFILCVIVFYKTSVQVYETKKAGVIVKDSMNGGEWYIIKNDTEKEKVINFFHLHLVGEKESVPPFDGVVAAHKIVCIPVKEGYIDLIDICELDPRRGSFSSVACINAARLRFGYKE